MGVVNISGDFVERLTAIGILAVVYSWIELDTLDYYLYVPRSLGQQRASAVFECIQSGAYNISLFSVEEGDLPFNRAATKVRTLSIDQGRNIECPSKSKQHTEYIIVIVIIHLMYQGIICTTIIIIAPSPRVQ